MLNNLKHDFRPKAPEGSLVQSGPVRFTVLTPMLIRLEYDPEQKFEDRPTQVVWYRDLPTPEFSVHQEGNQLRIETEDLCLVHHLAEISREQFERWMRSMGQRN